MTSDEHYDVRVNQIMTAVANTPSAAPPTFDIVRCDAIQFLSSLPDNSVDLIATDPAYSGMNAKLKLGHGRIVGKYEQRGGAESKWFTEFEDTPENYERFLAQCRRVLRPTGHVYIMFDSFSLLTLAPIVREHFSVKNLITWDKVNLGMGHYYRRRHEYILFATNGSNRKLATKSFPDVWRVKRLHRAAYPTQKPTEVFEIMVAASAQRGDVVCDPFMGSASSGIAALKYGCNFLGCDISEEAVALARGRLQSFLTFGRDDLQRGSQVPLSEKRFW